MTKDATHIRFRLRRTTTEEAYVDVPVTSRIFDPDNGFDWDEIAKYAVELGVDAKWLLESKNEELHPTQKPSPSDYFSD